MKRTEEDVRRDPRPLGWLFNQRPKRSEKNMDENIIIRPADSNEVCTAKMMLQIEYYLDRGDTDEVTLRNVRACVNEGSITAGEVLHARDIA